MDAKVNYTVVGAFVVVFFAATVFALLWLASGGAFSRSDERYLAVVNESVSGLNLNAPVKYRGVDVGQVKEITLDRNNLEQVRLVLSLEAGTPIKEDTTAVLRTQGLTGIAYLELAGGSSNSPPLRASAPGELPVIRTTPSLTARLETVFGDALAKLDSASQSVNTLLAEENLAAFKSTLADLAIFARTIAAQNKAIDSGIADAARTFAHSAEAASRLPPLIDKIGRSAESLQAMGDEVGRTSASAGKVVDSVGTDLKRMTADSVPQLQSVLGEMTVLTAALRRLVEATERNPRGFIFGSPPLPDGPGEGANAVPANPLEDHR